MSGKLSRSWALAMQSLAVLRQDKQLVLFPLLSSISCLLVLASFAVPVVMAIDWEQVGKDPQSLRSPVHYVILFAFYFVNFFVIAFFNAGLVACAMNRFEGEDTSVGAGLRVAVSRLPQILGWALVASTVGMVLRMIAERSGLIGRIVIALLGFVWGVATYFVVPVLVVEGVGPVDAVKRSAGAIRKTWGESLVTNLGLGAFSAACTLIAILPIMIGVGVSIATEEVWPTLIAVPITLVSLLAIGLMTSTLQVILQAALYRYAATGLVPDPFDGVLLKQVFRAKKKK